MEEKTTHRGFPYIEFTDLYGIDCTIQKSSLAYRDAIWFGVNDANPQIMASAALSLGIETLEKTGWITYPLPEDVFLITRMHLSKDDVKRLIPILQNFVDSGEVSIPKESK